MSSAGGDSRVPVATTLASYRRVLAQLPRSVTSTDDPRGAIVVVDGARGWEGALAAATDAGAIVVIVHDPEPPASAPPSSVPVLVVRPRLPERLRGRAPERPRLVRVEVCAPASDGARWVADGIRWAKELIGSDAAFPAGAGLFEIDGTPVVVGATTAAVRPFLRVTALGESTVEITIDDGSRRQRRSTRSTAAAETVVDSGWEEVERGALRRALGLARQPRPVGDLTALTDDARLMRSILDFS